MGAPLVSVLMPVHNASQYLADAVNSILDQTFCDFEFIIIDDGSQDNSVEILKSFDDKRIKLYENGINLKLIATLNKGLGIAAGKYIARMDADDISLPERLQKQVDFLEANPDIGVLGTAFISFGDNYYSESTYPADHFNICKGLLYQMQLCHPSVMMRRDIIINNNLEFNIDFPHAEDYDFFYRFSRVSKISNINDLLYKRRIHAEQVSALYNEIQKNRSLEVKRNQFREMGLDLNENQINLFGELNYYRYQKNFDFLFSVKPLLESVNKANLTSAFLPQKQFEKYLKELWFNTCTNLTSLGPKVFNIYINSDLKGKDICMNLKLLIKSFLKR